MTTSTKTTVTTTSTGAKVKQTTVVTMLDLIGFATEAGAGAIKAGAQDSIIESAMKAKTEALAKFNSNALSIKSSGVILLDGRKKGKEAEQTLALKTAFIDSLGDLAESTKQAYYEIFRKVVNSGEKAKGMNKTEGGRKGKVSKKTESKGEGVFANALAMVYNHSEFDSLSEATQAEIKAILVAEEYLEA
jgi:hypothetical protein